MGSHRSNFPCRASAGLTTNFWMEGLGVMPLPDSHILTPLAWGLALLHVLFQRSEMDTCSLWVQLCALVRLQYEVSRICRASEAFW